MQKLTSKYAIFLTLLCVNASAAGIITSLDDPALQGGTVDDFSSYPISDPLSVSDGFFTMTVRNFDESDPALRLSVRDSFNGQFGIVGRSVIDFNGAGIAVNFASAVSAFGIHMGAGTVGVTWTLEAFNPSGDSLGSGFVNVTTTDRNNGFVLGWADASIGSVVLTPSATDNVIFDNLTYVIPEPATTGLMIGFSAVALLIYRRSRRA